VIENEAAGIAISELQVTSRECAGLLDAFQENAAMNGY
jgi:hypothetical protein